MHRIGRTGRAEQEGKTILFYTEKEVAAKERIEALMDLQIPIQEFPEEVELSFELIPDEREQKGKNKDYNRNSKKVELKAGFHEKKAKNRKENLGGSYRRELAKKYKKPKTRGDKIQNRRKKKK